MRILSKTAASIPVPPAQEVIDYFRIDPRDLVSAYRLINAAREEVERHAGVCFYTSQVVAMSQPQPGIELRLPVGPLAATPNVICYLVAEDGSETEVTPANVIGGEHPEIILWDEPTWRVRVSYFAGFGSTAGDVPEDLVQATFEQALRSYDNRMEETVGLAPAAARIAARYKQVVF